MRRARRGGMMAAVPDLLVVAPIVTCDPSRPRAEAALARDGVFVRVGSRADCEREARRGTARIDARGAVAGLADAHGHVALLGRWRREVRCAGASEEECAARAAERAGSVPPGSWIRGSGWDQNRWPARRFPSAETLTRALPRHPAALSRVDGHALWVNDAALAAAGIGAATRDPPGGRILRDPDGRPAGVLLDTAQDLVLARIPAPGPAELEEALLEGFREVVRLGITSVHDAGVPEDVLAIYRRIAREERLPVRVHAMLDGEGPLAGLSAFLERARKEPHVGRLAAGGLKLFADGALGSRGAALEEDYADEPGNRGLLLASAEALAAKIDAARAAGLQPAVHAIGDRALSVTLDALESVARGGDLAGLRPRIEHLQILLPEHLPRLVRCGVIASMQPTHAASDASWVPARLGAGTVRLRGAYAWRTVLDAGIPLAFGSDFPVEDADPRAGLAAAETRGLPGAPRLPGEPLRREEALAAFTRGAAYAAFAERRRGMVREGMEADLTLFAGDVGACSVDELRTLAVTHTIVGGRVEYAAP
jgi:predicted amidohydrolase YtcJ